MSEQEDKATPAGADVAPAPAPAPAPIEIHADRDATNMVHQAVSDFINTLPPSAKVATEAYFRQVMPRCIVLPQQTGEAT